MFQAVEEFLGVGRVYASRQDHVNRVSPMLKGERKREREKVERIVETRRYISYARGEVRR